VALAGLSVNRDVVLRATAGNCQDHGGAEAAYAGQFIDLEVSSEPKGEFGGPLDRDAGDQRGVTQYEDSVRVFVKAGCDEIYGVFFPFGRLDCGIGCGIRYLDS
jgi:hypothetical protein